MAVTDSCEIQNKCPKSLAPIQPTYSRHTSKQKDLSEGTVITERGPRQQSYNRSILQNVIINLQNTQSASTFNTSGLRRLQYVSSKSEVGLQLPSCLFVSFLFACVVTTNESAET